MSYNVKSSRQGEGGTPMRQLSRIGVSLSFMSDFAQKPRTMVPRNGNFFLAQKLVHLGYFSEIAQNFTKNL